MWMIYREPRSWLSRIWEGLFLFLLFGIFGEETNSGGDSLYDLNLLLLGVVSCLINEVALFIWGIDFNLLELFSLRKPIGILEFYLFNCWFCYSMTPSESENWIDKSIFVKFATGNNTRAARRNAQYKSMRRIITFIDHVTWKKIYD